MIMKVTDRLVPFFFVLMIGFSCKVTDDESPDPSAVFVKYYGGSGSHNGVDLIFNETMNEYILFGSQDASETSGEDSRRDFYFVKVSSEGNQLQSVTFDVKGRLGDDEPSKIRQLDEDTYLFIGSSTLGDSTALIWGTIEHNELTDTLFHEIRKGSGSVLQGADIAVIDTDSVMIFGSTNVPEVGDNQLDGELQFYLSKRLIPTNLSSSTPRSWGDGGSDVAKIIYQTTSGGFILFGQTEVRGTAMNDVSKTSRGTNVSIQGTNSHGILDGSSGIYGMEGQNTNESVGDVLYVEGEYVITGTSINGGIANPYLLFVNSKGELRDSAVYKSGIVKNTFDEEANGYTLARTFDGGYLMMGSYNEFQLNSDQSTRRLEEVMVMKTNSTGTHLTDYDDFYGLVSGNDRANASVTLPDGKVAVLCTFDFGSGVTLLGLMKINANGQLKP